MKSFVVLCVVLMAGIHASNVTLPQIGAECMKQYGVSTEVLVEAKKGHIIDDEALLRFTFCFYKKAGLLDKDGKPNVEAAIAQLPPDVDKDELRNVIEVCKSKPGK